MALRDNKGRFSIGNNEWRKRSTNFLKPTAFDSPAELWKGACSYFAWVEKNPWQKTPQGKDEGVPRPYTLQGLYLHLNINRSTFRDYEKKDDYGEGSDYSAVCEQIRNIIYQQKLEGASCGSFNANIIARDLRMVEKRIQELTGRDGTPTLTATVGIQLPPDADMRDATQIFKEFMESQETY